jgi:phosphoribosylformimino-5-aminoimidazole carboxamide ribotide isomerase
MDNIQIREVAIAVVWHMRQKIMYPDETIDFVKLENDDKGIHLGLYLANTLIAVISVFEEGDEVQFRKFATEMAMQGKGYGTKLLQHVMNWAISNDKKSIWCNARIAATELYRKFGMQPVGASWMKYGIEFIKMKKQLV